MSNVKCQGTSISATLISALQWQLAMSKAFPKKLQKREGNRNGRLFVHRPGDLRWWSFLFTARAVQKKCTKTYGKKGVISSGHHLLTFSHFFKSNKKKNSLILSHFDSVKAPENISVMSQLLSEEHYRLCFSIYIHNMQTFTICHCSMVDGILYSLLREVQQGITFLYSNLPRNTHSMLRFARFHVSLVNPHRYYCKWLTRSEMWLKGKTQSWLVSLGFMLSCVSACAHSILYFGSLSHS